MKSNAATCMVPPFDTNPLTKMWHLVTISQILVSSFLEYIKLAELTIVHIISNVEDGRCFSTLAFMKSTTSSLFISQLLCTCLHNNFTLLKFCPVLNVLSSGEQHDIAIALMVRVQLFCGVANSVSTMTKYFVVGQVAGYVSVKAKNLALFNVLFRLLNLMVY
jgi:hypothetical protein